MVRLSQRFRQRAERGRKHQYSEIVPKMQTSIAGLFVANTTQIINSNLNNNAMVTIACRAVNLVLQHHSFSPLHSPLATRTDSVHKPAASLAVPLTTSVPAE
jgi:hypothetical protein